MKHVVSLFLMGVLLWPGADARAKGIYYMVKEDGSLCITDIPTSKRFKPYKFQKSINYIRRALVGFKRDKRTVQEVDAIVSGFAASTGGQETRHGRHRRGVRVQRRGRVHGGPRA